MDIMVNQPKLGEGKAGDEHKEKLKLHQVKIKPRYTRYINCDYPNVTMQPPFNIKHQTTQLTAALLIGCHKLAY